ncbi:two-component system histidine kinase PnpS [Metabacillus malikii]|uniref:histidine kinase n=1 Tax=Metabacillus malikii TaxID=1504265 RepID=A0ABT9ZFF1_9BACI|nr:ATP-binding protein [Metabacillus malikii]MDQ0231011.1 two-component system phosphate regulon sensor histidine kinase PhoR [Metabacillus malikii]
MSKFRSRLLFGLLILIISVLVGLGLLLGQIFQSYYINSYKNMLEQETKLARTLIFDKGLSAKEASNLVTNISESFTSQIIVLDDKDRIIHASGRFSGVNEQHIMTNSLPIMKNKPNGHYTTDSKHKLAYYSLPVMDNDTYKGMVLVSSSIEELNEVIRKMWGLLALCLSIAFIIIIFIGVRITRQYMRPIESATKVAMELAKGNYKARTYEEHIDETGMLSQSINILARNLQDMTRAQEMQQDRLQTLIENMGSGLILIDGRGYINLVNRAYKELFNVESAKFLYQLYYDAFSHQEINDLVEEIFMTEVKVRKQLQLPLQIEIRHFEVYGAPIIGTNDEWKGIVLVFHDITELKKLEQMRKDFVANVSHELKTPITSIKGFSETLLDGALNDIETAEYFLSIILKESDRLQTLVQDLLDLSKIEQQGFKLSIQKCDLKEILEDIHIILKSKAKEKEILLTFSIANDDLIVEGDIDRIKQIFINLINNALMYTPKDGAVHVEAKKQDGTVVITVSDNGIGIKTEEIPRIFERFYRVDRARSRNSGGTGLGLAIVKHLVEAHKGQINVQSKLGEGTSFIVSLNDKLE